MCYSRLKVGFFDSGIGGLTTLYECVKLAKSFSCASGEISFYYYGDNFRAPYGNLPNEKISRYVDEAFEEFANLQVDAVVLACNTVTAVCIERLRRKYVFPIIGIEPAIFSAVKSLQREEGEVLTLSTRATFLSNRFNCLCARVRENYPKIKLKNYPCEGLAGAIEKHLFDDGFDYTNFLPKTSASVVVLGCTHYVYVKSVIENFYSCRCVDGNDGVANRLFSVLNDSGKLTGYPSVDFVDKSVLPLKGKDLHFSVDNRILSSNIGNLDHNLRKNEKSRDEKPLVTPIVKSAKIPNIFFLGGGKMVNKTKYEQMFAYK